jgi:hypothetical protein
VDVHRDLLDGMALAARAAAARCKAAASRAVTRVAGKIGGFAASSTAACAAASVRRRQLLPNAVS